MGDVLSISSINSLATSATAAIIADIDTNHDNSSNNIPNYNDSNSNNDSSSDIHNLNDINSRTGSSTADTIPLHTIDSCRVCTPDIINQQSNNEINIEMRSYNTDITDMQTMNNNDENSKIIDNSNRLKSTVIYTGKHTQNQTEKYTLDLIMTKLAALGLNAVLLIVKNEKMLEQLYLGKLIQKLIVSDHGICGSDSSFSGNHIGSSSSSSSSGGGSSIDKIDSSGSISNYSSSGSGYKELNKHVNVIKTNNNENGNNENANNDNNENSTNNEYNTNHSNKNENTVKLERYQIAVNILLARLSYLGDTNVRISNGHFRTLDKYNLQKNINNDNDIENIFNDNNENDVNNSNDNNNKNDTDNDINTEENNFIDNRRNNKKNMNSRSFPVFSIKFKF